MQILGGIRFGGQIATAARAHGLDPKLLAAVAAQETGGPGQSSGNNIVGDGGHGHGLFQIDDRSWAFARTTAAMDPAQNADKAASILADDLGRYGGDVHKALSAYNTGSPDATGTTTTWADGRTSATPIPFCVTTPLSVGRVRPAPPTRGSNSSPTIQTRAPASTRSRRSTLYRTRAQRGSHRRRPSRRPLPRPRRRGVLGRA